MVDLPYREHTYIRFLSTRTGETLFEIKMLDRSLITWGAPYRPDEFSARLADDGRSVAISGALRDRCVDVITFGEHLDICSGLTVEVGELPADFDPSWKRDTT